MSLLNFTRAYPTGSSLPEHGLWFIWHKQGLVVSADGDLMGVPQDEHALLAVMERERVLHLGSLQDRPALAFTLSDDVELPAGFRSMNLRDLYGRVNDEHYAVAGYATQLLQWQKQANFCMVCGTALLPIAGEWGKKCPNCGHTTYPPVSPCTITLVHDSGGEGRTGDDARILMTHKDGWGPRYGLVAGFVEPGESLEENVTREVLEETGVSVTHLEYWRSQPWPFPHQIMCGFYARYAAGEVRIDAHELDDACWFTKREIRSGTPVIPPPLSIARQLIDHWMAQDL